MTAPRKSLDPNYRSLLPAPVGKIADNFELELWLAGKGNHLHVDGDSRLFVMLGSDKDFSYVSPVNAQAQSIAHAHCTKVLFVDLENTGNGVDPQP